MDDRPETTKTIDRTTFESIYAGQAPWDIGKLQKGVYGRDRSDHWFNPRRRLRDGRNRPYFASKGYQVTGIDFLEEPINRAKQKAAERGLPATFLVMDALRLKKLPEVFDSVFDSGLFQVFSDEDRRRYVEGLETVLKLSAKLCLLCFSDEEPGTHGHRRVSRREIENAFAKGWKIEAIEPTRFEVRLDLKDISFSPGGPKAWFVVARAM